MYNHILHSFSSSKSATKLGFTLIELSIVLVIIGLIVGGVLVGQDLIHAAGVRAQITQIERYNRAVNTFRGKYNGQFPGDMNSTTAKTFGFAARGACLGQGDGDGVITGVQGSGGSGCGADPGNNYGNEESAGETTMFWSDLTYANGMNINMIEGSYKNATPSTPILIAGTSLGLYFPASPLGNANYVYVWSKDTTNYFGVSSVVSPVSLYPY